MAVGTYIEDLGRHVGETVVLRGWLYNSRHSGKLYFLLVRDGTGTVQGVVSKKDVDEATWQACESATQEAALVMAGTVRADERAPGGFELTVSEVRVAATAVDYPITPKDHGTDFLMDHRHLWLRSSRQHAILRVRHELVIGIRDFL
ncbi:MAG: asparaginyl-tRNA synthetase, partial [bacterium]